MWLRGSLIQKLMSKNVKVLVSSSKNLNTEQRRIFDDVIERLASGNELTDGGTSVPLILEKLSS